MMLYASFSVPLALLECAHDLLFTQTEIAAQTHVPGLVSVIQPLYRVRLLPPDVAFQPNAGTQRSEVC